MPVATSQQARQSGQRQPAANFGAIMDVQPGKSWHQQVSFMSPLFQIGKTAGNRQLLAVTSWLTKAPRFATGNVCNAWQTHIAVQLQGRQQSAGLSQTAGITAKRLPA
jgi:hypothetical protein